MEDLAQRLSAREAWRESPKAAKHREAAEHQRHSDSAESQASGRQNGGVAEHQSGRRLERPKSGVAEDRSNRICISANSDNDFIRSSHNFTRRISNSRRTNNNAPSKNSITTSR